MRFHELVKQLYNEALQEPNKEKSIESDDQKFMAVYNSNLNLWTVRCRHAIPKNPIRWLVFLELWPSVIPDHLIELGQAIKSSDGEFIRELSFAHFPKS